MAGAARYAHEFAPGVPGCKTGPGGVPWDDVSSLRKRIYKTAVDAAESETRAYTHCAMLAGAARKGVKT